MGSCILFGFGGSSTGGRFEDWAKANLTAISATIPSRGQTSWYDWTKSNFVSGVQNIPQPTATYYDALVAWAKQNFIMVTA